MLRPRSAALDERSPRPYRGRPSAAAVVEAPGMAKCAESADRKLTEIYIDGDACPVREEIYRVAARLRLNVFVVFNGSASELVAGLVIAGV